jgi:hypothetical protein
LTDVVDDDDDDDDERETKQEDGIPELKDRSTTFVVVVALTDKDTGKLDFRVYGLF